MGRYDIGSKAMPICSGVSQNTLAICSGVICSEFICSGVSTIMLTSISDINQSTIPTNATVRHPYSTHYTLIPYCESYLHWLIGNSIGFAPKATEIIAAKVLHPKQQNTLLQRLCTQSNRKHCCKGCHSRQSHFTIVTVDSHIQQLSHLTVTLNSCHI